MAVSAQRVTVSTTAVALNTDVDTRGGTTLVIKNTSANAADLGPSTVTAGTGLDLAAGATVGPLELGPGEQLFAIRSAAADATVAVLRIGV
jgi:hypothetical protein